MLLDENLDHHTTTTWNARSADLKVLRHRTIYLSLSEAIETIREAPHPAPDHALPAERTRKARCRTICMADDGTLFGLDKQSRLAIAIIA